MNTQKVESEALLILEAFDQLPEITMSSDWEQSLMSKIAKAKHSLGRKIYLTRFSILVIFALIFNVSFVLMEVRHNEVHAAGHAEVYHIVSMELFINPIANN